MEIFFYSLRNSNSNTYMYPVSKKFYFSKNIRKRGHINQWLLMETIKVTLSKGIISILFSSQSQKVALLNSCFISSWNLEGTLLNNRKDGCEFSHPDFWEIRVRRVRKLNVWIKRMPSWIGLVKKYSKARFWATFFVWPIQFSVVYTSPE